jgi:glycosyltransferase involved in cell wall biosynthesis
VLTDLVAVQQANRVLTHAGRQFMQQMGAADLIHNHDWMTAQAAQALARRHGVPLLATVHATERGRWQGHLTNDHSRQIDSTERQLVHAAQQVVVCSHYMAAQVRDFFHVSPGKLTVIPNAVYVQPEPFTSAAERIAFRRRFVADDEHLAFFIGRMVYEKGVHVLIDAWARVLQQMRGRLVIGGVGPMLDVCRAQVAARGLDDRVLFTEHMADSERDRLYRVADVAAFPSLYEPFGIVALEAMAAGCPVVVTETGGFGEIVRSHENGISVLPDHIDALTWGLLHTLQHPVWARKRAEQALHEVQTIYSWQRVARDNVALYQRSCQALAPVPVAEMAY